MIRHLLATTAVVGLTACSGGEFLFPDPGGGGGGGGVIDPGTGARTTFSEQVNKVDYDAASDQLVVNNLPFDGPDGIYTRVAARTEVDGFGVYRSLQTAETGQRRYYAVFRQTANGQVAAIATPDYADFGFGGRMVRRSNDTTITPRSGEYVYTGLYAGLRTFSNRGGLELVEGDVLLEVDIDDFDITGAVEGRVTNRTAYNIGGVPLQPLPNIVFSTTSISAGGVIDQGTASTRNADASPRDTGTYQGLFVGPNGEEILGTVSITGSFVAYRITETFEADDGNGGTTTETRTLSYQQLLDLRAAGSPRLGNVTIDETNEDFTVRELGVLTAAD